MTTRQARQIRWGITAAWLDMTGQWDRPPLRHRLHWRAYNHTLTRHSIQGERSKLADARLAHFRARR
jgi:hypothetical protein